MVVHDILTNVCLVLGAGCVTCLVAAAVDGPHKRTLAYSGIVFGVVAALGIAGSVATASVDLQPTAGDSYTNSGSNFGHMGPVNNYGKQPFELRPELISQIVNACPPGIPVKVMAVGPQKAFPMQDAIAAALRQRGFTVILDGAGTLYPLPEHPVEIRRSAEETMVVIAPNA